MTNWLWIGSASLLCFQWIVINLSGLHPAPEWQSLSAGLAIFGAAFMLSWAAELAQLDIPQALAIALLALIAVLPEYAVDMYFAWEAGKDPQVHILRHGQYDGSESFADRCGVGGCGSHLLVKNRQPGD